MKILKARVDGIYRNEAIKKILGWIETGGGLKQVVTLYSEFVLAAERDVEFRQAIDGADLVVPDGVAILAALRYKKSPGLINGLKIGLMGLKGELGEPVTGVWLFEELVRLAGQKGLKVFLLGGFGDTAARLAAKLKLDVKGRTLDIGFDAGEKKVGLDEEKNERLLRKINKFEPDLLFVAYGPVTQEKWIYKNKSRLKAKVAIGVGGSFNEALGEFPRAPGWMERRGLKALWRLAAEPKRLPRVFRAMIVFPFKIWVSRD